MSDHPLSPDNKTAFKSWLHQFRSKDKTAALSPPVIIGLIRLIELAIVYLSGILLIFLYPGDQADSLSPYIGIVSIGTILTFFTFQGLDLYQIQTMRRPFSQFARLLFGWIIVFLVLLSITFFAKIGASLSRYWLAAWLVIGLFILVSGRIVFSSLIKRWTKEGRLDRNAVIVGGGEAGASLIEALQKSRDSDVKILGVFDDRTDERSPDFVAGVAKLGKVDDILEFARNTRVDLIIVSIPITAETRLLQMLRKLWVLPIDIRLSAHTNRLRFRPRSYSYVGDVPMLDVFDKPLADWDMVLKWFFDKIFGLLALILTAPIMIGAAIAIKWDSKGPIIFKQKRYGFNNELIEVYKFRSMYVNMSDATAAKLVTKDDPRVTRVGRFIRKTSIDELPQLFNVVFKGNLSLVGPRPHAVHAKAAEQLYQDVVDGYYARHRVKPGITGWAQINGWRGETDTEDKIQFRTEYDLYYIENWSILFDLYILIMTPVSLLTKNEGAY